MWYLVLLGATGIIAAAGFGSMAFSQAAHWSLIRPSVRSRPPAWLRPVGWMLIALSSLPAIVRDGMAFGLLLWIGMLTFSALAVAGGIAWLKRQDGRHRRSVSTRSSKPGPEG